MAQLPAGCEQATLYGRRMVEEHAYPDNQTKASLRFWRTRARDWGSVGQNRLFPKAPQNVTFSVLSFTRRFFVAQ